MRRDVTKRTFEHAKFDIHHRLLTTSTIREDLRRDLQHGSHPDHHYFFLLFSPNPLQRPVVAEGLPPFSRIGGVFLVSEQRYRPGNNPWSSSPWLWEWARVLGFSVLTYVKCVQASCRQRQRKRSRTRPKSEIQCRASKIWHRYRSRWRIWILDHCSILGG